MRQNCTSTDTGIATAVSSEVFESVVEKVSGVKRWRLT